MEVEYNSFYDDRMVFSLDVGKLRPGDVILTRNRRASKVKGRVKSAIIAAGGRTRFSHAMICSAPPTLIEALGKGVSTLSANNCFFHAVGDVRVLRYPDRAMARRASDAATMLIGKSYSFFLAMASVLPIAAKTSSSAKTFCSALVASVYRQVGAPEFQLLSPLRATPGTLARLEIFEDVTEAVMRSSLAAPNIEGMNALDGERRPSPLAGQAAAMKALHEHVVKDISQLIRAAALNQPLPGTLFETYAFIVRNSRSAANGEARWAEPHLGALRKIDEKLALAFDQSALHAMQAATAALDAESMDREIRESHATEPDIDVAAMRSLLEATGLQIAARSQTFKPENRQAGLSMAWDRWCDFSASIIDVLKHREIALRDVLSRIDAGHQEIG